MTGQYEKHLWPEELALDDSAGPAPHITRGKADLMIANALLEAGFAPLTSAEPAVVPQTSAPVVPARKQRGMLWQVAAAIAVAFVGAGSASAAVMLYKRIVHTEPVIIEAPKPKAQKRRAKPVQPVVEAKVEEPVVLEPTVVESEPEKVERKKPARKPEDFLDDANRLRADKRWRDADEAYARVWQAAPNSPAAYVARVASASVRLEHLHDARGALARYRAALEQSPRGALLEEIRFGIAECHRARKDVEDERKALEAFLHDHPGSGLAKKARARLAELDKQ